jgi:hypothetical protein
MILYFTSWYNEPNEVRREELLTCLENNLASEIDQLFLICENCEAPVEHEKLVVIKTDKRPTYQYFFEVMNRESQAGDVVILANTDIFVKDTSLLEKITPDDCYALSRWEGDKLWNHADSQDVWVFRSPIEEINGCCFANGVRGCDNAIAHRIHGAGYNVTNPSKDIKFYHLHSSEIRNYKMEDEAVSQPYRMVNPTWLPKKRSLDKVLHVGFSQPPLERAFANLSEVYTFIEWTKYQNTPDLLREKIKEQLRTGDFGLLFFHIQTAGIITPEFLREIHSPYLTIVNWTGDVRRPLPKWYIEVGKEIDLTLFSNETDMGFAKRRGINAEYLNIGFDTQYFIPGEAKHQWPDIVFLGNNYQNKFPLSKMREEMVEALHLKYKDRFGLYGNGWKVPAKNLMNNLEGEADCYRGCKIAINLSHFNYERYSSDRNLRIMGSGAFCLSHNYLGIEKDFMVGQELDVFNDIPDLIKKINYWYGHMTKRKGVARTGCLKVHREHRWENRVKQMREMLCLV